MLLKPVTAIVIALSAAVDVTALALPGGLCTVLTRRGVYHPDGRPTQRIGIVPDIVIQPTLAGLRTGRD